MKTTAIANYFGSNRTLAETVGQHLGKCDWVGVPFCGGCPELPFIKTRSGVASDLHRHVLNLARVIREPELKTALAAMIDATPFHPDELAAAQSRCVQRERERDVCGDLFVTPQTRSDEPDLKWAFDYFLCTWMTPGGRSGTAGEFKQGMSFRWNAGGGDSCTRFRSASESLEAWCQVFRSWNFVVMNAFDFLSAARNQDYIQSGKPVEKREKRGLYLDPPWPDDGDSYKHGFTVGEQRRLAAVLAEFAQTRVVIRFGDHPLIRELYPAPHWAWVHQTSRAQSNGDVAEVLILNPLAMAARLAMEAA